jgi:flagellar hook-length control protein FliK
MTVAEQPVAEVPRDIAPAPKPNTPAAVKAQAEQAPQPETVGRAFTARQSDGAVSAEQAAQVAQAVASTSAPAEPGAKRGDSAPVAEQTMTAAEALVNTAASQGDGDASAKDAGKQASSDAAFEIAPAARSTDAPVAPAPAAVTPAVEVTKPAAVQPTAAAPIFTPAEETENLGRLVQGMRVQWRQGVPEATVRLNPEHLGEVTIQIRVERGVVSATFHAETPAVQQWLEAQEDKLRSGLADQGLNLERYAVQRDRQQQERREQRPYQQARYRQPQNEGQRFEVTV